MKDPSTRHPTLAGRWMANGGPPQWVSFTLQLPRNTPVANACTVRPAQPSFRRKHVDSR